MNNFGEKVSFIWSVADLIRDSFKRSKYQDVILPFTVLKRIDSVLQPTKAEVFKTYQKYKDKLDNLDELLRDASGYAFYNTSKYDFEKLLEDSENIAANIRNYINGFSENMRDVLEHFDFLHTIRKLEQANLLFLVIQKFNEINLHPDVVGNLEMGYIFEELIRKFNEATNENPGEHFTPREVIHLMSDILVAPDLDRLKEEQLVVKIYDPTAGSGGMLSIAKDKIISMNDTADVRVYGQELNPETFAVCKSDFFLKTPDGRDAEHIYQGSTLSDPKHRGEVFDYMLANPPYGKDWKQDKHAVVEESHRGYAGRFGAGLPRSSDGQLLFTLDMLSHKAPVQDDGTGGSRIAVVANGSPLFTGDAGSGESEIRRWILENDMLEAIIALPEQLFYNTGIATYIWILTNRKQSHRKGYVQLIDATELWDPMRKSLGSKRREISEDHIQEIVKLYSDFKGNETVKIFRNEEFGFRKIRVEQPLKLNFQVTEERLEMLWAETAFHNLAKSKKKKPEAKEKEIAAGEKEQQLIIEILKDIGEDLIKDQKVFEKQLKNACKGHDYKLKATLKKAIIRAIGEQDETAEIVRDKEGNPEPDTDLRDYENVPLTEDIEDYFEREVKPHIPEAWIDAEYTDDKDGEIGKVGYEIPFTRHFYTYEPPRPLEVIEVEIKTLESEIQELLKEI